MSRAPAIALAVAIHLIVLAPLAGDDSAVVSTAFREDAEASLDGEEPYGERDFEYPPLALPLLWGPAALSDDADGFELALAWEMIIADLAIVGMLGLGLRNPRRAYGALAAYTVGIVVLSGAGPLPNSALEEAALPLARFDLAPAALALAALLAREASRSASWGALLGLATALKAYPAALFPVLARGEGRLRRAALAALVPLLGAAILVLTLGDSFGSAISYHTGRDLQVESLGASPLLLLHLLGVDATATFGAGSWNLEAPGAAATRLLSLAILLLAYVAVVRQAWVRQAPLFEAATAALAVVVVLAPVLSPQFLLWLLPVSAAAFGLRIPNLFLLAALALTAWVLNYYGGVQELEPGFVFAAAARNLLLAAYLALVMAPLFLREPAPGRPATTSPATP